MVIWGIIVRFAQFAFSHGFGEFAELKLGAGDKVPLAQRWICRYILLVFRGVALAGQKDVPNVRPYIFGLLFSVLLELLCNGR